MPQAHVRWRVRATNRAEAQDLPNEKDTFNEYLSLLRKSRINKFLYSPEPAGTADPTNPTVLMATVSNTYDNLICARITNDATQVACGFQVRFASGNQSHARFHGPDLGWLDGCCCGQDRVVRVYRLMEGEGPAGSETLPSAMEVDGTAPPEPPYKGPLVLRGHSQPVYGLSWSPEQRHLLSCSGDGTVRWGPPLHHMTASLFSPPACRTGALVGRAVGQERGGVPGPVAVAGVGRGLLARGPLLRLGLLQPCGHDLAHQPDPPLPPARRTLLRRVVRDVAPQLQLRGDRLVGQVGTAVGRADRQVHACLRRPHRRTHLHHHQPRREVRGGGRWGGHGAEQHPDLGHWELQGGGGAER